MTWKETLPEAVREWDEVKNSETPEAFFDQITEMRSSLGQSIRIPGDDANEEARLSFRTKLREKVPGLVQVPGDDDAEGKAAFFKHLGRPDEVSGYTLPEDHSLGEDTVTALQKHAHEAGLSTNQFLAMATGLNELSAQANSLADTKRAEGIQGLKEEWGQAYEEKRAAAELVRAQYFPFAPEGDALGVESIKAFAALGAQMAGESDGQQTQGKQQSGAMTPGEAQLKISEIMNNKEHPYWNRRDIGHQAARARMSELNRAAFPG